MRLSSSELEPATQPCANRLVVGTTTVKIESFQPLGDVEVDTPSGSRLLHHAASAQVRSRSGRAVYVFGEYAGGLMGAQAS
jgi:hypothetical protein